MVKYFLFITGLLFSMHAFAQTGIGTTTPHTSAKLDVSATNKGFLPPRVSLTDAYDRTTISNPANGLLVYCKGDAGLSAGYYFWNGSAWATIATEGGSGSVAAEYGASFLPSAIAVTSATPLDIISFTLPTVGTWEVISFVRSQGAAGYAGEFGIYDASNSVVPNSEILSAYGEIASTGTGVTRITTTGAATFKLKAYASTGSYSVASDNNGRTGVTWKKISGNAPVTGQSVDYGIARFTGADTGPMSALGLVLFDATAAGNLAWSGNKFTLKANKTYELESSLAIYQTSGGTAGRFQIYDYTNAASLANGLFISMNGSGTNSPSGNAPMKCIITPSTDIQVGIRLLDFYGAAAPGIVGSTFYAGSSSSSNASYFIVKQIGSSAIVNPWVLSGNDVYNTTGNVGIGTNAPASTLDVTGSLTVSGATNLKNTLNVGTGSGLEGGEVDLSLAQSGNTSLTGSVGLDVYGDKFRIFENGGNARGVNIDIGKAPIGASGELIWKTSGIVNAGVFVNLDNIKATIPTSGNRGLCLATASGTINGYISGHWEPMSGGVGGFATTLSLSTTLSTSFNNLNFIGQGDTATYIVRDDTNNRIYRIVIIIGGGYSNNFISIERLY